MLCLSSEVSMLSEILRLSYTYQGLLTCTWCLCKILHILVFVKHSPVMQTGKPYSPRALSMMYNHTLLKLFKLTCPSFYPVPSGSIRFHPVDTTKMQNSPPITKKPMADNQYSADIDFDNIKDPFGTGSKVANTPETINR